ncbi:divalent-cation tolerance protein CutA [Aurantiacibacter aquimixticola]|uniref:Divalent-cation tolerance protein CutA n=1 Tax=Aurantiacibacter aquimixticola TaxID=1958945 RepID=A0A419RUT1_9SPHN|nr:divalent-cation tolerance protein CutA [Aurantiacibacter aquimixticola]RJY09546.1 divalent-cation tolerance protein CutA [Aurantiacibacter aquimixticola]
MSAQAALIWSPFGDEASAREVAGTLLAEGLVACANILPGMISVYRWRGETASDSEVGVLLKTTSDRLEAAMSRLDGLHPYDTPTITAWRCDATTPATLDWLAQQTALKTEE